MVQLERSDQQHQRFKLIRLYHQEYNTDSVISLSIQSTEYYFTCCQWRYRWNNMAMPAIKIWKGLLFRLLTFAFGIFRHHHFHVGHAYFSHILLINFTLICRTGYLRGLGTDIRSKILNLEQLWFNLQRYDELFRFIW